MKHTTLKPKKSLGQHFLMHARIAERIVKAAGVREQSIVFEIGPGTGMLTRELLKKVSKVIALEADYALYEKLQEELQNEIERGQLELIHGDVRTFAIESLPTSYEVVANIPYYITGEIFRLFLEARNQPSSMTLLIQKEVAERIARAKKESILSLSVKAYGTPKFEFSVPRGAFVPAPKVDSAVLSVKGISRARFVTPAAEQRFFDYIHAGFAHKRKLLHNNVASLGLSTRGIPPKARAEDMTLEQWLTVIADQSRQ